MVLEQYFASDWRPMAAPATTEPRNSEGCFECNICLDSAHDPVVTPCGHLYCWACIYKWLHSQTTDEHPQCPVCKAVISRATMIPLYGRGQAPPTTEFEGKVPHMGEGIPPRPSATGIQEALVSSPDGRTRQRSNPRSPGVFFHSVGETVLARVFGNSNGWYAYPNSYRAVESWSPRSRRMEGQADKSLSRVSIFLSCCVFLCLVFF